MGNRLGKPALWFIAAFLVLTGILADGTLLVAAGGRISWVQSAAAVLVFVILGGGAVLTLSSFGGKAGRNGSPPGR